MINPITTAEKIRKIVSRGLERKYYRLIRPGRWYGGIATADCCGCNLNCVFCWSNKPRDNPQKIGDFYSPEKVAGELIKCARRKNYRYIRISGNEPTICQDHLLKVLTAIKSEDLLFILETNGTLLDMDYIKSLAHFKNLHIRISLKGTTAEEFSIITGAIPETFDTILENLENLLYSGLRFNLAVMLSFSPDKNIIQFKNRLEKISQKLLDDFEEEYVFLYPHVVERLKRAGIRPFIAYTPEGIPGELI